jgi:hypothetical protein
MLISIFIFIYNTQCVFAECRLPTWGENCANQCSCTGRGADRCDRVKGCICEAGWQGDTCDVDVNECDITENVCSESRKECVNTQGSFSCNCRKGYTEKGNGTCQGKD